MPGLAGAELHGIDDLQQVVELALAQRRAELPAAYEILDRQVARFTDWCADHGQTALPASPETVAAFLAAEARAELAVNTLRLRHAAIRYLHLLAGYPPPTAAAVVSTTFAGIRRAHRRPLD